MSAPAAPRIGIAGFFLEANRFASVTTGEMFANSFDLAGEALLALYIKPALIDALTFTLSDWLLSSDKSKARLLV